jgi:hypothetical protein
MQIGETNVAPQGNASHSPPATDEAQLKLHAVHYLQFIKIPVFFIPFDNKLHDASCTLLQTAYAVSLTTLLCSG